MSKRKREQAPTVGDGKAACLVLGMRDLVCNFLIRDLSLTELWSLYQSCASARRVLFEHPDIVVWREARTLYHGSLGKSLKHAFKRGDTRLRRSLCHYLSVTPREDRNILQYACGVCLDYVLVVWTEEEKAGRRSSSYLAWSLEFGIESHYYRVRSFLEATRDVTFADEELAWIKAVQRGCLVIASTLWHSLKETVPMTPCEWVQQAVHCKDNTRGLDHALAQWPSKILILAHCLAHQPYRWTLLSVQWIASYANREGIRLEYEALYASLMDNSVFRRTIKKPDRIMEWLRPLALRQFSARRKKNPSADPLWPANSGGHCVYVRHCCCGDDDVMKFPGIRDELHYAYGHPENMLHIKTIPL